MVYLTQYWDINMPIIYYILIQKCEVIGYLIGICSEKPVNIDICKINPYCVSPKSDYQP